jgi:hypothetical protein
MEFPRASLMHLMSTAPKASPHLAASLRAWERNVGDEGRRRAGYERDTLVAGVPQEVQVGAPEPSSVPQFMQ